MIPVVAGDIFVVGAESGKVRALAVTSTGSDVPRLPSRGAIGARVTLTSPHTAQPMTDFFS